MPLSWWSELIWLFALALGAFLVTWLFTDLLRFTQTISIGAVFQEIELPPHQEKGSSMTREAKPAQALGR